MNRCKVIADRNERQTFDRFSDELNHAFFRVSLSIKRSKKSRFVLPIETTTEDSRTFAGTERRGGESNLRIGFERSSV